MPWIIPKCVIYENQYWCCMHGIILSHISGTRSIALSTAFIFHFILFCYVAFVLCILLMSCLTWPLHPPLAGCIYSFFLALPFGLTIFSSDQNKENKVKSKRRRNIVRKSTNNVKLDTQNVAWIGEQQIWINSNSHPWLNLNFRASYWPYLWFPCHFNSQALHSPHTYIHTHIYSNSLIQSFLFPFWSCNCLSHSLFILYNHQPCLSPTLTILGVPPFPPQVSLSLSLAIFYFFIFLFFWFMHGFLGLRLFIECLIRCYLDKFLSLMLRY